MTPTPFSLFNLVIFAVIRLAGRAGEAEVFSRDGAACGPNGLSANHAPGTVLLGRQCFVQRFNKVGPVITFVVSHDHVGIFLNRDWLHRSVIPLAQSYISDGGFVVCQEVSFLAVRGSAKVSDTSA